jgi:hypothetical protein
MAGSAVHRLDGGVKRRQIEPSNEIPHQAHPVIVRQKTIQTERAPSDLIAFGKSQTWQTAARRLRRCLLGQTFKQFSLAIRCHRSTFVSNPNRMPILDGKQQLAALFRGLGERFSGSEVVPIVTDARPSDTMARAALSIPVIEVRLAGAVVRVASGLDDAAPLTAVLRAVRASASRR